MFKYFIVSFIVSFSFFSSLNANQLSFKLDHNFYSNYAIEYRMTHYKLFSYPITYKFSYSTSRLNAMRYNRLKTDHFKVSFTWIAPYDWVLLPYFQTSIGHISYVIDDSQFDFLDNNHWTYSASSGAHYLLSRTLGFHDHVFGLELELVYSFLLSSVVNPVGLMAGIFYEF
tara:strand:+ start:1716 stop:2228 length:513 start_codon:yes stop_codon:yes gene_type:complete